MKLLKVISIVLCILTSSLSKAEEFNLIDEVLYTPSDIIKKFEDKGLGNVLNRYDTRVKFKTCKNIIMLQVTPKEFKELEDILKFTHGTEATAFLYYGLGKKLITKADMALLKAYYEYMEKEISTRYSLLSYNKDPNLSKYEDKLESICKNLIEDIRAWDYLVKESVKEYYYSK